jgi:uncharacterized protein (UPF0335 family)
MTERLRQLLEQAERLEPAIQDALATKVEQWLEELEERAWDAIVSKPKVRKTIREMAAKAREQEAKGETEEGGWELE